MTDRSSWEPRRWSDAASDVPDGLRPALQEARALPVDQAQLMRLAERVGVNSGVAAGIGLSSVAPPTSVVAFKLWAYLSGAVAIGGVALVVSSQLTAPAQGGQIANVAGASADALRPEIETPAVTPVGSATGATSLNGTDNAALTTVDGLPASSAQARATVGARSLRRRSVQASNAAVAPVANKLDPQAELLVLNRAQDALAQAPRRALTLASDHARDFPQGVFAQEREVIAIEALLKLQRSGDASDRGRAFLNAFPTSTHAPRVRQMLGQ